MQGTHIVLISHFLSVLGGSCPHIIPQYHVMNQQVDVNLPQKNNNNDDSIDSVI